MRVKQLEKRAVARVWGRRHLAEPFRGLLNDEGPIGEIWFEDKDSQAPGLLVKYLFTSEKLSVQVHPNDEQAKRRGHPSGKDEAWLILEAEPGAVIGMGLRAHLTRDGLRAAALDGSLEELLDWRRVEAGDVLCCPAGTIHAIGAGISLIEVQQDLDVTYRLYDYGRPRELHLDEATAVADPRPLDRACGAVQLALGREVLAQGPNFVLERWRNGMSAAIPASTDKPVLFIPFKGAAQVSGISAPPGSVWKGEEMVEMALANDAEALIAYSGAEVLEPVT